MAFRFGQGNKDPAIVAFGLAASLRESLSQFIAPLHLQLLDHIPKSNYYILSLASGQSKPPQVPDFIPVVYLDEADLYTQIAQALLYLQAHNDIKQ